MGETPLVDYRNWTHPRRRQRRRHDRPLLGQPVPERHDRVYTWYDEVGHRFIVQWYSLLNDYSNCDQNFEVILLRSRCTIPRPPATA